MPVHPAARTVPSLPPDSPAEVPNKGLRGYLGSWRESAGGGEASLYVGLSLADRRKPPVSSGSLSHLPYELGQAPSYFQSFTRSKKRGQKTQAIQRV